MKLDRVLRKSIPFLLIAILIACLFSKPQREGMKKLKMSSLKMPKLSKSNSKSKPKPASSPKPHSPNPAAQIGLGVAKGLGYSAIGYGASQGVKSAIQGGKYLRNYYNRYSDLIVEREEGVAEHEVEDIQSKPAQIRHDVNHPEDLANEIEARAEDPQGDAEWIAEHPEETVIEGGEDAAFVEVE